MMTAMTTVNIFIFFILPLGFEGVRVDIHPPHLRVSSDPTNITVTCRSSAPITGCQFSWWSNDYDANHTGPVLDLNMGAESVADPAHLEDKHGYPSLRPLLGYSYSGRGFSRGDCGVRMEVEGWKTWLISCRVKTADTWVYDWMDLTAHGWDPIPHTLDPRREVVVVPGGQARILLKTRGGLRWCVFILPVGKRLHFYQGPSSPHSTGRHLYQGAGPRAGECGLALGNITEEDNGLVRSGIESSPESFAIRLTPLIVVRPPSPPELTLSEIGNNITATCRVQMSRPAPNITWFLGDQVIPQDDSPGTEDDSWRWPWMGGSWSQKVTVSIQPQDTGKELKCSITHVALARPLEAVEVLHSTGCGIRRSNSGGQLVSGGEDVQVGEFPWHVGVYRKSGDSYEQWGAGSLITPQVVLSAAHCFWNETERKQLNLSEFWVVAGKTIRAWEDRDHRIQKRNILRVDTNYFYGRERNLGHDIALVFLKDPLFITDSVRLVCLNWGSRPELQAGDIGVVPGWGYTENQNLSTRLRYINLPFIPKGTCFAALPLSEQPLLTYDKFCAGHRDSGKSVCGGDSGDGLVFLNTTDRRYYLRGIVSTDFRPFGYDELCYTELYTAFIDVSSYLSWIERKTSQLNSS